MLSDAKQRLLEMRLRGERGRPPIVPVDRDGPLPLSFAQQRLWFLEQLEPGSADYNVPAPLRLAGSVDEAALRAALAAVVERHEVLRTRLVADDGVATQVVDPPGDFPLDVVDVSGAPDSAAQADALAAEDVATPFDLAAGPLCRARLIRIAPDDHLLSLVLHHVVCDEWSTGLLHRELSALYDAFRQGSPSPLPPLAVQYADYALWQRRWLQGEVLERQVEYWRQRLHGLTPLDLPTDRPRAAVRSSRGATVDFVLHDDTVAGLRALARASEATLPMILRTGYSVLLGRFADQDDVVVGMPVAGRDRPEVEALIGFFVNTLALRTDLAGDPTFAELVGRVRQDTLAAFSHQELPFEQLVDILQPERDPSRTPLFQVLFDYAQAGPGAADEPGALAVVESTAPRTAALYELILLLSEDGAGGLRGVVEYSTDLFDRSTVERFVAQLGRLLAAVAADPEVRLSELPLLEDGERRRVVSTWNDNSVDVAARLTATGVPADAVGGVDRLIAAHAARDPGAVAVVAGEERITYGELDTRANRLAHHLQAHGVSAETVVGVCLARGMDQVVAVLAVLKAGGAYLPLDPEYPAERLAFMLRDSGAAALVGSSASLAGWVHGDDVPTAVLDDAATAASVASAPGTLSDGATTDPETLACVIYTSGSTGRPKGAQITHRALLGVLAGWAGTYFEPQPGLRWLSTTSFSFDVFTGDLVRALGTGGTLVVAPAGLLLSIEDLAHLLVAERIEALECAPRFVDSLVDHLARTDQRLDALRLLVVTTDLWRQSRAARAHEVLGADVRLLTAFGLTETTIDSTYSDRLAEPVAGDRAVAIGRPLPNARCYVLDRHLGPVPLGVPGELYIGGVGLARGYGARPALTAQRFVADPFSSAGTRLFRTGDRARWRPDGVLDFLGRADEQVKVRGFRIEPGEVEAALVAHPAVGAAAVAALDETDDRRLVAYVVARDVAVGVPASDELRAFLGQRLPAFMVPALFVELVELPLGPNGKLDRTALPAPDRSRPELDGGFVGPRDPTEELLAGMWMELLGLDRVGVFDGFFDLGGHSLLATQVMSRVRAVFAVELPLATLFADATIAALAAAIERAGRDELAPPIVPVSRDEPLPLSFAQQRLWFLDQLEPGSTDYNLPLALRLEGPMDVDALRAAVAAVVERHEVLRTRLVAVDGVPAQVVDPPGPVDLVVCDLTAEEDPLAAAQRAVAADSAWVFDLAAGPLFRARLLRLGAEDHVLSLVMHHVTADEWSAGVLLQEIRTLYTGGELASLPLQYGDFAAWQRGWLQGDVLSEHLGYWRDRLAGAPVLELPTDRPRPPVRSSAGAAVELVVPAATADGLRELSRQAGATVFMTLLAGLSSVLGRYAGQDDVVVGTLIANRNRAEIEDLIGFFVNTLVLRTDLSGDPTFAELVARVRGECLGAYAHQDVPFEHLVEALEPERDRSRTPLFQVLLNYEHTPLAAEGAVPSVWRESTIGAATAVALFDLTLSVQDDGTGPLAAVLEYSSELFEPATIERLAAHLVTVLGQAAQDADRPLATMSLVGPEERAHVMACGRGLDGVPPSGTVHELIGAHCVESPDATAVRCGDVELAYGELGNRADQLARHLRAVGVGPEAVVGVCLERGVDLVVALLAIWKAGAAGVLIDPDYPDQRVELMLADSGASLVVTRRVLDDLDVPAIAAASDPLPVTSAVPGQAACVIYTSGSTGRPKGVVVTHAGLVGVLDGWLGSFVTPGLRWLSTASASFDVFVGDVVRSLATGGTLVLAPPRLLASVQDLARTLIDERIQALECAPRFVDELVEHLATAERHLPDLQLLAVTTDLWHERGVSRARVQLGADVQLCTAFGLTETTIDCTSSRLARPAGSGDNGDHHFPQGHDRPTPIGTPLAHTAAYVLDRHLVPQPVGVPGELYVGGVGVARGYLQRPALTAQRFVADPCGGDGGRLYRTGDRARWRADGELDFHGRLDEQVNVRGFRVEPGEVETALRAHPAVRDAVVVGRDDPRGGHLAAYLVVAAGVPPADELRSHLAATLPQHLIPALFVELATFPRTPTGKIDRAALPTPDGARPELTGGYTPPATPTEEILAGLWAEILGLDRVGADDGFFDLGGHSLLATQVVSRLRGVFDVDVPVAAVFDHPTVAGLAAVVDSAQPGPPIPRITRADRNRPLPLSYAQQRLWFLDQLSPGSSDYNEPLALRLQGPLDVDALGRALDAVVERHEILRTRLVADDGVPHQVVDPAAGFALTVVDVAGEPQPLAAAVRLADEDATTPFDLAGERLIRGRLIRISDDDHVLSLVMHHLACDEWSVGVLYQELLTLYDGFRHGAPVDLPALDIQYADFAVWQRGWLQDDVLDRQVTFWRERLTGAAPLQVPTDRPRLPVRSTSGDVVEFAVPDDVVAGLRGVARASGATMFMTLLSGFEVLLGRYAGQDDVVVGTPIANRNRVETEGLVGYFVNTLVLRTDLSGDPTFADVVGRVRRTALDAYSHQDVPFEQLVDVLEPERDRSRTPLFQVLFNYEQDDAAPATGRADGREDSNGDSAGDKLEITGVDTSGSVIAKFDLRLVLAEQSDGLGGSIEYSTALFDRRTVVRLVESFEALLRAVAAEPGRHVSELPLLSEAELSDWNDTASTVPSLTGIEELVAAQAQRDPDVAAVVCGTDTVTYRELDERSNQLAHHLRAVGVGPETRVGVCAMPSIDLVVALLGVAKSGGAFVPLDPRYPTRRLSFLLGDSKASVVVGQSAALDVLPVGASRLVVLDDPTTSATIANQPTAAPAPPLVPVSAAGQGLAYVMYTSGSTGDPKGVLVTRGGLVAYVAGVADRFGFEAGRRHLLVQSPAVDFGYTLLFGALTTGGMLHVVGAEVVSEPGALAAYVQANDIDYLKLVPSHLAALTGADQGGRDMLPAGLLILGGEAPMVSWLQQLLDSVGDSPAVLNHYGPTETTVGVATCHLRLESLGDSGNVPVGLPLPNAQLHVLDRFLQPVPCGVPGELYLGGAGLARSYGNQPALTAHSFVANPFTGDGSRLYRSGDRARRRTDGQVEVLGRLDDQLKVRGYRIEPGEVEAALATHPAISAAAVAGHVVEDDRRLVAYVVADGDAAAPNVAALRGFLADRLPEHMVPSLVVELDELPLNATGKLDRRALPAPAAARPLLAPAYVEPTAPTAAVLAGLWADVLGVDAVGAGDNFFDLGGHSLLATQVVSRIRTVFDVDVPLADLFDHPTVAELAAVVESATPGVDAPAITPVDRSGPLPLSFAQQRLWFLHQLQPGSVDYNVPLALRLQGPLDIDALGQALTTLVERHEILRTRLEDAGGVATQHVDPPGRFRLLTVDVASAPDPLSAALEAVTDDATTPFDLAAEHLFRGRLLRLGPDDHILSLVLHHLASDGWSIGVLHRELMAHYDAAVDGRPSPLPALPIQYADFAVWQRQWLRGEVLATQLRYWRDRLHDVPTLDLPTDRPRPPVRSSAGAVVDFRLDEETVAGLRALSRRSGVTMFMTLLAAFDTLLHRYSGQDDAVVGSLIANRNRAETEGLIGFFVNTLVLRSDLAGDPSFVELLARVRDDTLGAYAHQDLPFEQLVDELQPERDRSRTPLFQVLFNYEQPDDAAVAAAAEEEEPPALGVSGLAAPGAVALFDLTLALVDDGPAGVVGSFEYSTELFDAATVEALARHLQVLLASIVERPSEPLSALPLLDEDERARSVAAGAAPTSLAAPEWAGVYELFAATARRIPDAIALEHGDQCLTFRELLDRADRLARHLAARGVAADDAVGICLERGADMVVALLGVLGAGGAYVPLDPAHPAERLRHMASASRVALVVGSAATASVLATLDVAAVLRIDEPLTGTNSDATAVPPRAAQSDQLAYAMYTSGSTGRPKGVLVSQAALVNLLRAMAQRPGLDADDVLLAVTTLGFDISALELLAPLLVGARVVVADRAVAQAPDLLAAEITRCGATVMQATPATWQMLVDDGWPGASGLRVLCGGEALTSDLARDLLARCAELWNMYGPTETTVWSSCERVADGVAPGLGEPIADTQLLVLDACMQPVPLAVPGELYIGGAGVARGYDNQASLTAARFVANPFSPGTRLYRTGDRVRRRGDGRLEFLGRADHQLKVRGFRVEPAEVEAGLLAHPALAAAVVASDDDRRLIAYVVPAAGGVTAPTVGELRAFLEARLPTYMVPGLFVKLDQLPLSPAGKVDRAALPTPDRGRSELAGGYVVPSTPTSQVLAGLWADVLELDRVGLTDNFFESGGHSLLATRVVSHVRDVFDVELPLAALFDHPTIAGLASVIDASSRGLKAPAITPVDRAGRRLPLSFSQQRLWFLHQLEPISTEFNLPLALRLEGPLDVASLNRAFTAVLERHEVLRTRLVTDDGVPYQHIDPPHDFGLDVVDVSREPDPFAAAERMAAEDSAWVFDLAAGPLLKARLIRLGPDDHVLSLVTHHSASDEWSSGVLHSELTVLYEAFSAGEPSPLPPLEIQYGDVAVWQRGWLQAEVLDRQLAYWKARMAGAPVLELPIDRPRPPVRETAGAVVNFEIAEHVVAGLRALANELGATTFMTLLAGFSVVLGRYTNQDDVVVGTPIAQRNRAETEGLIGFFVNTILMRTDLSGDPGFRELLSRVRHDALEAYSHQDLPFEQLVDALQPERDRSRTPLFQALFNYEQGGGIESAGWGGGDLDVGLVDGAEITTNTDMRLVLVGDEAGRLGGSLEYSTGLFDTTTIERLVGSLLRCFEQVAAQPDRRLSELAIVADAETDQIARRWNATTAPVPRVSGVHELLAQHAARRPAAVAVVGGDRALSYAALDEQANQLAHHLRSVGVGPETVVGLCVGRTVEWAVCMLGILKAGGAFLPLDPEYPAERLAFMVADSRVSVVVGDADALEALPAGGAAVSIVVDDPRTRAAIDAQPTQAPEVPGPWPDQLAYVIYTSGSTGQPKGVLVGHGGLVSLVEAQRLAFGVSDDDVALQFAPFSFDASVWEVVMALGRGATLVVATAAERSQPELLASRLRDSGVTIATLPPSLLGALDGDELPGVGTLICAGERLSGELVTQWGRNRRLFNAYGPTETTVCASVGLCDVSASGDPSIGGPIANMQTYVLDRGTNLVPRGVAGELYVGGAGIARGYHDRPSLTAERFVADPFAGNGTRLYRTGDRVRWSAAGELEFLGRVDAQLKLRGHRIEPGEIEAALEAHPALGAATVTAHRDVDAGDRLVAYVVPDDPAAGVPSAGELQTFLRRSLPAYLVPAVFVELAALPLGPSGKVERSSLPAPDIARRDRGDAYVAPRTPTEATLATVWAETLGLERVGIEDNFFELGGDSIVSIQMVARARRAGIVVTPAELFASPTIAELSELAVLVEEEGGDGGDAPLVTLDQDALDAIERRLRRSQQGGEQ